MLVNDEQRSALNVLTAAHLTSHILEKLVCLQPGKQLRKLLRQLGGLSMTDGQRPSVWDRKLMKQLLKG